MKRTVIAFALLFCLLLPFAGCGAHKRADTLSDPAQYDCYPEWGSRIPTLESVIPDGVRTETDGSDANGTYHRYEYVWAFPDANALSDRFVAWLETLNGIDGVGTEPYLNGTYYILVGEERVGLAGSSRTDDQVCIFVTLYTNV